MKWIANHRMALLGAAVSAAYWPNMLSAAFTPRWAIIGAGLPLVSNLDPRNIGEPMRWVLAWILAFGAVSIIASPDQMTGWLDLFYIVLLCGAFLAGAGLQSLDDVMTGLGAGLALSSAICVAQSLGYPIIGDPTPRPAGLFFNSEVMAEFAAVIFVWAACRPRWGLAVIAAIPIALCFSRVAIVASLLGLIYTYRPTSRAATLALLSAIAVIALAMVVFLGVAKAGSADQRIIIWGATLMAFKPLGTGLGWFQAAHPAEQYAHSDAIQLLVEIGIGAMLAIVIPIAAFWKNRGTYADRAAFVAICFEIVVSFPLHVPATAFMAAIVAGYLVSVRPDVRLGLHNSQHENVGSVRRGNAAGGPVDGHGQRGRRAFSVRSLFARAAARGSRPYQRHPQGAA